MTIRYNALIVTLKKDMRDDDAEALINAISMIRGVESVGPRTADLSSHIAYTRARADLERKLFDVLRK